MRLVIVAYHLMTPIISLPSRVCVLGGGGCGVL